MKEPLVSNVKHFYKISLDVFFVLPLGEINYERIMKIIDTDNI